MSDYSVLQEGRARRRLAERAARRRRIRRRSVAGLTTVLLAAVVLLAFLATHTAGPRQSTPRQASASRSAARAVPHRTVKPTYGAVPAPASERVTAKNFHVRSAVLFDVWTGRVLWEQNPGTRVPIASLTKMMTALEVVAHSRPSDSVLITPQAVHFSGSGVGLLPLGKRINLVTLLYGLLLPSGNDAAIALAQHVSGTEGRFIALMNHRARAMGLDCTHFTTESGIVDQGNYSCTTDLAVMAHAILENPLLARIVATRTAVRPFPIKGGKLYLYNNNPLLGLGYPGTDGIKTGYTTLAGRCLVASARRGHTWLGVVLLGSVDPGGQAQKLFDAGFARLGTR